ncbi:MAG: helix-turn-helix domain-containing protein [Desulfobaccales bacterium]
MSARKNREFQGAKLRLARTFHGFSLAELGEQISVTRQYIQRLEVDPNIYPKDDIIAALAELLQVEQNFFFEPLTGELNEEVCHFRKLKTTPLNIRKKALAYGTIFNYIVSYIENKFKLPDDDIQPFKAVVRSDIERIAEKCRLRWRLHIDTPIHNMIRTVEKKGCVVTTFKGVSSNIDAFSYFQTRPIIVRNTAKVSTSRARFDIAHELGHLVLHQDLETDDPLLEDQANQFASAFLLPRIAFLTEFPKYNRINWSELIKMKIRWGVSLQAIVRRAYDLRIIDAIQYRNANVYINRNGWKTEEPGENEIISENPEIVPSTFEILAEKRIFPEDVANELHLKTLILEKFGISVTHRIMDKEKKVIYINKIRHPDHKDGKIN